MVIRSLRLLAAPALVLAGLALQQPAADAAFNISATSGGSAFGNATYSNFDNRTLGNTTQITNNGALQVSFTGSGAFVQNSSQNQYQAPIISGFNNNFFETTTPPATPIADTTTYISSGVGSATLTFLSGPQMYLGLLWGSVDTYNSLTFNLVGGGTQTFTGADIMTAAGSTNTTGTLYVNITSTVAFTSVVASSTRTSFELDNVAYSTSVVPEPSSMALCGIAGVIGMAVARKRAKRVIA